MVSLASLRVQEKYIAITIVRWNKRVSEVLRMHCVDCYKERCEIIAAETPTAHEQHVRQRASELLEDVRKNTWKITHDAAHLIDRTPYFFNHGNITNVQEWTKNMTAAIICGNKKMNEDASDLHNFFSIYKTSTSPEK